MAREKIGVKMREHDVPDHEAVLGRELEVLVDVTLRIDDHRRMGLLVAYEIRGVRQTVEVELLHDHVRSPSTCDGPQPAALDSMGKPAARHSGNPSRIRRAV